MKLIYEDDYGNIYNAGTANYIPRIGDTLMFDEEYFNVTDVVWDVIAETITVHYKENVIRSVKISENNTDRLNAVNNAILALNKRQDESEKKTRALTEQVGSVRKHINQRIKEERKTNADT
jgi:hypothetical protein